MSNLRRAARADDNQKDIVKALRKIPGVTVQCGHDDILVGCNGHTYWIEVKSGPKAKLRPGQEKIKAEYTGHYAVCWTIDQILKEIGII